MIFCMWIKKKLYNTRSCFIKTYYKMREHFSINATNIPFAYFRTKTVKCDSRELLQHVFLVFIVAQCFYINMKNFLYKKAS